MATWNYSSWITETSVATRLTQLRLHIAEVTERINTEISGDGKAESSNTLGSYLQMLLRKERELEDRAQQQGLAGGTGSVSQVRVRGAE